MGTPGLDGAHSIDIDLPAGPPPAVLAPHSYAVGGLSMVVGHGFDRFYAPDRIYVSLKLPPEPHTFKVVLGGQDHDNRGSES